MRDLDTAKMRGFVCRAAFSWAWQHHGEAFVLGLGDRHAPLVEAMGIDLTRDGAAFLPSVWYPAAYMHVLAEDIFGAEESAARRKLTQAAGVYVFDKQLNGLQRALLSLMMSPSRYIKHASKAWLHNFNDGDLFFEAGIDDDRRWHRCIYTNWSAHHPVICQMMMQGKRVIYEAMGCKDIEIVVERCDPDGDGCSSSVHWTGKK